MSLTSILDQKLFKEMFKKELGNIKPLFKSDTGEAFPKNLQMIVPPIEGIVSSSLGNVGTAYDLWFRSFLQRHNQAQSQEWEFDIVYKGLNLLKDDGVVNGKEYDQIFSLVVEAEELRDSYSKGEDVDLELLLSRLLNATYCQNYFRTKYPKINGYDDVNKFELRDTLNLAEHAINNPPSFANFKKPKNALFNPTFGKGSIVVGGADADLIADNTLIDIKTTKSFGCKAQHYNQIIGYYLLDKYQHDGVSKLEKLGLYFSK